MRARAALVVLLGVWPAFGQEYRFAGKSGEVDDVLAAYSFLQHEAELEPLYAAAARNEARSAQVWNGLESFVRDLGIGIADRATEPHCLFVPVGCTPDWSKFDGLSRTRPGGIRLRQVLAEAFKREARQRGLENRLAMSLANSILAGIVVAGAIRPVVPEATVPNALTRGAVGPATVRVFRVEGIPNTRIVVGTGGQVAILGEDTLFLNFGNQARAEEFLAQRLSQRMPGATVRSFEVPQSFLEELRSAAVPERLARQYPDRPIIVDATKAPDQLGLRPDQIEELRKAIVQGTGKEGL